MESPAGGLSIAPLDLPSLEGRTLELTTRSVRSSAVAEWRKCIERTRHKALRDVAIKVLHHVFGFCFERDRLDPIDREAPFVASSITRTSRQSTESRKRRACAALRLSSSKASL